MSLAKGMMQAAEAEARRRIEKLRDDFAIAALQGALSNHYTIEAVNNETRRMGGPLEGKRDAEVVAAYAYECADAMLAARSKK